MEPQNTNTQQPPLVYQAARAVGVLKPKIQSKVQGQVFSDSLDVRGTGFWLKDYKVIITCCHVVQDLLSLPIETAGLLVIGNRGNYLRAVVSVLDFEHDLAVIQLYADIAPEVIAHELETGLNIAENDPSVGTQVGYAGYPFGTQLLSSTHAPTYSQGIVGAETRSQGNRKDIQITGTVAGGFSGAPIVEINNPSKIVAVLSNSPNQAIGQAGIFMGISWKHVKAIAELANS